MAIFNIVKLSNLMRFKRLDPEYYEPTYIELYDVLTRIDSVRLGDKLYAQVKDGIHDSIDYDPNSGIRCLSAQSVKRGFFDLKANTFISEEQHRKNKRTELQKGDVIISSVGTIGNAAVVDESVLPSNADRHVGIIRPNKMLDPHYLSAFLNCKYGIFQTMRESTGNVQKNLFIDKMKEILVPILPDQGHIAKEMSEGIELINKSRYKFREAQSLLLDVFEYDEGWKNDLTYTADYLTIINNKRFDAEYFHPKFLNLIEHIEDFRYGVCKLSDYANISKELRNPSLDQDRNFVYVELSDVDPENGSIFERSIIKGMDAPSRARMVLHEGDIIVSSVTGSLDKVAYVDKTFDNSIGSTGFFVLKPINGVSPFFLLALFKSPIVQLQLERESTGTVLTSIRKSSLEYLILPNIPVEFTRNIEELVKDSLEDLSKGREKVQSAITYIEEHIDNFKA